MRNEQMVRDRLNTTLKEFDCVDRYIRAAEYDSDQELMDMIDTRVGLHTEIRILRWVLEDETARWRGDHQ